MSYTQPHSEAFLEQVKRYRKRVLAPAGLDFTEAARRHGTWFPQNAVFESGNRVWKFYGANRRRTARNTVKASKLLLSEGIPTPSILFKDVHFETVKRHHVACVIMERIHGGYFDPRLLAQPGTPLAGLLARMHRMTSDSWGDLTWKPSGSSPVRFVESQVMQFLENIQPLTSRVSHPSLEGLTPWLLQRLEQWKAPQGAFQFVHGDIHESNLLQSPEGDLAFIDLDFSGYRFFGFDLADLIQRNNPRSPETDDPRDAFTQWESHALPFLEDYFNAAPDSFREQWRGFRDLGFLLVNLRKYLEGLRLATPEACAEFGIRMDDLIHDLKLRRQLLENLSQVH